MPPTDTTARTGLLRQAVRQVLHLAGDYAMTRQTILQGLTATGIVPPPSETETREAIDWNMSKGYVDRTEDEDFDRFVYRLTESGKARQPTNP